MSSNFSFSGTPDIDLDDLKVNTEYHGGYTATSPQIRWFWEIVREMNVEDRARLLMFCTGTSKVPLDGFEKLRGMSGLHKISNTQSAGKRPESIVHGAHMFQPIGLDCLRYQGGIKRKITLFYTRRKSRFWFCLVQFVNKVMNKTIRRCFINIRNIQIINTSFYNASFRLMFESSSVSFFANLR